MKNIFIDISQDELSDAALIERICDTLDITPTTPCAFSAIIRDGKMSINMKEGYNTYSPSSLVTSLYHSANKDMRYTNPPIDVYLAAFRPLLQRLVTNAYPQFSKCIPDREDLEGILYLVIVKLYNKNYYLNQYIISRAFINELCMEVRKIKYLDTLSLDALIAVDDDTTTLCDMIPDPQSSQESEQLKHYTDKDYDEDMFNLVKSTMLREMSQLSFDRILIQLSSHTIEVSTSKILRKYREKFAPLNIPRPGRRTSNGKDDTV